jgi:FkbM family methyltransferase
MTRVVRTDCLKGGFLHLEKDLYIPQSLKVYGGWENEIYEECKQYIKPNSTIIEVGSHIGTHTIPLAKLCPNGFVFGFEMQRFMFQLLNANIIINGCANVLAYQEMVSDTNADVFSKDINYDATEYFNSGNTHIHTLETDNGLPIRKITLDSKFQKMSKLDLIKIDVECHELQVLQGAIDLIQRCKPIIVTEFHTVKTKFDDGNKKEIINLLPNYIFRDVIGTYELNDRVIVNDNMIGVPK